MATIDSRGFVDDGSPGLQVVGSFSAGGITQTPTVLTGANQSIIPGPGFYQVAASGSGGVGAFTGSVPSPATYPGGMLGLVDTLNVYPFLLSGAAGAVVSGQKMFVANGAIFDVTGTLLSPKVAGSITCQKGASISLISDGLRWLVLGASGSFTFNAA